MGLYGSIRCSTLPAQFKGLESMLSNFVRMRRDGLNYFWILGLLWLPMSVLADTHLNEDRGVAQPLPVDYREALDASIPTEQDSVWNPALVDKQATDKVVSNKELVSEQRWLMQRVDRLEQQWRYVNEQNWGALIDNLQQKIRHLNGLLEQQSYQLEQLRIKLNELESRKQSIKTDGVKVNQQTEVDSLPEVIPYP